LRAYDYYGLEWRLPLLDADVIEFFNSLTLESMYGKKFFTDYLSSKIDVPYSRFSVKFIRKVFRNVLDIRYACINPVKLIKLKNKYNKELPLLIRVYRYLRNFTIYSAIHEIEMMKKEISGLSASE